MNKYMIAILLLALFGLAVWVYRYGFDEGLTYRNYDLKDPRIVDPVRIVFLSDLHSNQYGDQQADLMGMVDEAQPDLVILGGDIIDEKMPQGPAQDFLSQIASRYPVFFATGNHEYYEGRGPAMKALVRSYGIPVLEGETRFFDKGQTHLVIAGIDDLIAGQKDAQWQAVSQELEANKGYYRILINHRPESFPLFGHGPIDLMLAGHAHGGQWRIPGLINGVYAPNQGLLPLYAGGYYRNTNDVEMIVSRGLETQKHHVPRIFNPPEVVVIDLKGE